MKDCANDLESLLVAMLSVGDGLVLAGSVKWDSEGDDLVKDVGPFSDTIHTFIFMYVRLVQIGRFLCLTLTPTTKFYKGDVASCVTEFYN